MRQPLLPLARAGLLLLVVLATVNGLFLYLLPQYADTDYAWSIAPDINAAAIGAGYLAGVVATALAFFARDWRLTRPLVPGLAVLAIFLLGATLIEADRFRWDYPPTWLWTAVYVAIPFGLAVIWRLQERESPGPEARDSSRPYLGPATLALAAVLLVLGLMLFATPTTVIDGWPWELTPLVGRVVGAWYLLAGTILLVSGGILASPGQSPIAFATVGSWSMLLLLLPLIYSDSVQTDLGLWLWIALHLAALVLCAAALATYWSERER
jgi:hypothetical protein